MRTIVVIEWKKVEKSRSLLVSGASECLHYLLFVSTDSLLIFLLHHGSLKKPMSLGLLRGFSAGASRSGRSCISTLVAILVENPIERVVNLVRDRSDSALAKHLRKRKRRRKRSKIDIKFYHHL